MTERDYYLAFSNFPGVGPINFKKIIANFGSAEYAWSADLKDYEKVAGRSLAKKI